MCSLIMIFSGVGGGRGGKRGGDGVAIMVIVMYTDYCSVDMVN